MPLPKAAYRFRVPLHMPEPRLTDGHGRVVNSLRVSISDRCNYRCTYCCTCDVGANELRACILRTVEGKDARHRIGEP
jgi:hypothetical protein